MFGCYSKKKFLGIPATYQRCYALTSLENLASIQVPSEVLKSVYKLFSELAQVPGNAQVHLSQVAKIKMCRWDKFCLCIHRS